MQINYLIAGLYGEEAGRHIFETMTGLLVLNQKEKLDLISLSDREINDRQFENIKSVEGFEDSNLNLNGKVYQMQTRRGDGGLDILVEKGDLWSVYQCKFFVEGKLTTAKEKGKGIYKRSSRIQQIEKSFNKAIHTAKLKKKIMYEWVLCIPKDLDDLEKLWLEDFKENNKDKCENIKFMGNLDLSNWLIENENIQKYFFHRLFTKESDLEIRVFEELDNYYKDFDNKIVRAENPASVNKTNLSNYQELELLINHIKEFREEFKKVLGLFKTIDNMSNHNKEEYEKYSSTKYYMSEDFKNGFANLINNNERQLMEFTKKREITDFKNYLQKVVDNFNDYFSSSKL